MEIFTKVKVWNLLGLILIMIFALSAVSIVHAIPTLAVSSTISNVSGAMAYDSGKGEIYVSGFSGLSVVSDSSNQVVGTVAIPGYEGYLEDAAYDSGQNEIFVASGNANAQGVPPAVWVFSDSTNSIVANVTSGIWWVPWGVVYDSVKGEIFLTDAGNGQNVFGGVYVVSDSNNSVIASIGVGNFPEEMAYDSGMGEIFVANTGSSSISVISDSTNTVVATISGVYASGLAYDSSKGEIFAANGYNAVSVISDSTNTVVANVTGLTGFQGIAYDSAKGEIFTGNSVISDSNNAVVAQVPNALALAVYDSGKGEIIGSTSTALDVFSDSSSASTSSPSPTSSPSATSTVSASPTPKVPEFSSAALASVAAAMIVVTLSAVAVGRKKSKTLPK